MGVFDDAATTEVVWRRWSGSVRNAHGQMTNSYKDQPIRAGVDDLTSRENTATTGSASQAQVQGVLFLPPGTQVDQRDRFVIGESVYEVEHMAPLPLQSMFTGLVFRTEVHIKRVTG